MNEEQTLPVGISKVSDPVKEAQASLVTLAELEREHIEKAISLFKGNKTQVAKVLGISLKTLYNKLHSYGLMDKADNGK